MSEVVCTSCGSQQVAGSTYCALCGCQFPRTGWLDSSQERGAVFVGGPTGGLAFAGLGRRIIAVLLDGMAIGLAVGLVVTIGALVAGTGGGLTGDLLPYLLGAGGLALILEFGQFWWQGRSGATLGNTLLKVRVVDQLSYRPTGFLRAFLWWILFGVSNIIPVLGPVLVLISPAFDSGTKRQGWVDRIVKVVAIDARTVSVAAPALETPPPPADAPVEPAGPPAGESWYPGAGEQYGAPAQPPATPAPSGQPYDAGAYQGGYDAGYSPEYPAGPWDSQGAGGWAPAPAEAPAAMPAAPAAMPAPIGSAAMPGAAPWNGALEADFRQAGVAGAPSPDAPTPYAPGVGGDIGASPMAPAQAAQPGVAPAPGPAPASAAARTVVLHLATGEAITVSGPTLIGRNPQDPDGSGWALVPIPDPTRSVSKTHLELGVDGDGLWVRDRGSTNGTIVQAPGQPPQVATPGALVRVPADSTIHVGDQQVVVRGGST